MLYQFEILTNGVAPEIQFTVVFDNMIISKFICDGQVHFINHLVTNQEDDIKTQRNFQITMHGKNQNHTIINKHGDIQFDCHAIINKIVFDEINVTDEFCQGQGTYMHNNNGNSDTINDEFYGFIGCNGTVNLMFNTPLHIWMLEKCQ